jgi:hypothetical protein
MSKRRTIEISERKVREIADFLSLLGDYLRADPAAAPLMTAHAKWTEDELREHLEILEKYGKD